MSRNQKESVLKIVKNNGWFIFVLAIAVFTRFYRLGSLPIGMTADEAYGAYDAWSMLNYGTDSWGYTNPVYLVSWGSGMSALQSYLEIPFISKLGLNYFSARLPQAILSVIAVVVVYFILEKQAGKQIALLAMFLLTICPWHIMNAHKAVDCYMAPNMVLIGAFFWLKAKQNKMYYNFASLFWGLSLYCYATTWYFLPIIVFLWGAYTLYAKQNELKDFFIPIIILFLFALPLLLFVAVNLGLIDEIKTSFISVPRMVTFRNDELSFSLFQRMIEIWNLYFVDSSAAGSNNFYKFSIILMGVGILKTAKDLFLDIKKRTFNGSAFYLISYICVAFVVLSIQEVNINHMNLLHIGMIIACALGIDAIISILKNKMVGFGIIILYLCSFSRFFYNYSTDYQKEVIFDGCNAGIYNAVPYAMDMSSKGDYESIVVSDKILHPWILFSSKYPTDEYVSEVTWNNFPAKWLRAESFGIFQWEDYDSRTLSENNIYIIKNDEFEAFVSNGYMIKKYDSVGVAYKKK